VLERKFAEPPSTSAERARQARFLAGRGFSHEVIARALRRDGAEQHATFDG
jgi:regulatory protein